MPDLAADFSTRIGRSVNVDIDFTSAQRLRLVIRQGDGPGHRACRVRAADGRDDPGVLGTGRRTMEMGRRGGAAEAIKAQRVFQFLRHRVEGGIEFAGALAVGLRDLAAAGQVGRIADGRGGGGRDEDRRECGAQKCSTKHDGLRYEDGTPGRWAGAMMACRKPPLRPRYLTKSRNPPCPRRSARRSTRPRALYPPAFRSAANTPRWSLCIGAMPSNFGRLRREPT